MICSDFPKIPCAPSVGFKPFQVSMYKFSASVASVVKACRSSEITYLLTASCDRANDCGIRTYVFVCGVMYSATKDIECCLQEEQVKTLEAVEKG